MENTTPPSPKAAAIWYLWSSAFNMAMRYEPRWTNDVEPYAVQFPKSHEHEDFVRLSENEAQWLIRMKEGKTGG